ncbi:oligosaccharide flippase family protein [Bacillus testis]|uniref:oligosaccharide flippase family protein n=1 Tax=Bacillus testis TaxID=1622072 RepID=UPI00067E7C1D|nr:oligosaccharide flippase family protein [Bacillus testis]
MPSLKKNLIYNISYQILIVLIPLIISPYISRVLGPSLIGVYSYSFSIANYFVIFAALGVSKYGSRSIAQVRNNKELLSRTFISIYTLQVAISFIVVVIYILYLICYSGSNYKIALILIFLVISNIFDITWFFFGIEEFKITVTRNTIIKVATLLAIFLFVKSEDDFAAYTFIMAGGTLIGQISVFPFLRKRIYFIRPTLKEVLVHIKPNIVLFIPVLAISIFTMMDKLMLGLLSDMEELGYYENADKIISIPKSLIRALGVVMLSRISNLVAEGKANESKQYLSKTILYVAIIASALSFGLAAVGPVFAPVFWGSEFTECGEIITYLTPALIFSVLGNILRTQYLIPNQMDKEYTISSILAAVVNVVVNAMLIGRYGAMGAVIGTICAELTLMVYQIIIVSRKISIFSYYLNGYMFYIIGLMMFCFIRLIQSYMSINLLSLLVQIVVGGIFYIVASYIYIMISRNKELYELKKLLWMILSPLSRKYKKPLI